jgi:hypothetical protein
MSEKTVVIFRKWRDKQGEIMALFPHLPESRGLCSCYVHMGQHSSADYAHCVRRSRPATPSEYEPLARELRSIGYTLDIRKRKGKG